MRENRFGMMQHFLKGDFEPLGIMVGIQFKVFWKCVYRHVFPWCDFLCVDAGDIIALPNPDMVEFMLSKSLPDGSLIYKGVDFVHRAGHAHLFHQPAWRGFFQSLASTGMAATSVGPQARGVVLRQGSLLHEKLAFRIEQKDRESPMKMRINMGCLLLHLANFVIVSDRLGRNFAAKAADWYGWIWLKGWGNVCDTSSLHQNSIADPSFSQLLSHNVWFEPRVREVQSRQL